MDEGLGERLFSFAVDVLAFLGSLPKSPETQVIRYQLAKHRVHQEPTMKRLRRRHQNLILHIK